MPTFTCPKCSKRRPFDETLRGKKIRCRCGHVFRLGKKIPKAPIVGEPVPELLPVELPTADSFPQAHSYTAPPPPPDVSIQSVSGKTVAHKTGALFTKQTMLRLMLAMTSGTLAILFAFLAISATSDLVLPMFEQQAQMRRAMAQEMPANATPRFIGVRVFSILAFIIAVLYGLGGLGQWVIGWWQCIQRDLRHFAWVDVAVAALSVICLVALIAAFVYANYQVFEMSRMQNNALQMQRRQLSSGAFDSNPQFKRQIESQLREVDNTFGTIRWFLFRQVLVHALIPAVVMALSLIRVLRN